MKRFVVGDIHGRLEALQQVLKLSNFDYDKDLLIILGDVVDGGYATYLVVEELIKIKNKVFIIGNHDVWWMNHMKMGWSEAIWVNQGGKNTLESYGARVLGDFSSFTDTFTVDAKKLHIPQSHVDFFNSGEFYHVLDDMVFVHGGFDPDVPLSEQSEEDFTWDRELINEAMYRMLPRNDGELIDDDLHWKHVFVGHTTTQNYHSLKPCKFSNLTMVDTGAGWSGVLTIMNIDTEEYYQSDIQKPAVGRYEDTIENE